MKVFTEKFEIKKIEEGDTYLLSIKISDSQVTVLSVSRRDVQQLKSKIEQALLVNNE